MNNLCYRLNFDVGREEGNSSQQWTDCIIAKFSKKNQNRKINCLSIKEHPKVSKLIISLLFNAVVMNFTISIFLKILSIMQ